MSAIREQRNGSGGDESLCVTCTSGQVIWGFRETQMKTLCHLGSPIWVVPFPVRKCTSYQDRRQPELYEMKQVAHVLVRGQRGKQVGFVTPDQYREMEEQDQSLDGISQG